VVRLVGVGHVPSDGDLDDEAALDLLHLDVRRVLLLEIACCR